MLHSKNCKYKYNLQTDRTANNISMDTKTRNNRNDQTNSKGAQNTAREPNKSEKLPISWIQQWEGIHHYSNQKQHPRKSRCKLHIPTRNAYPPTTHPTIHIWNKNARTNKLGQQVAENRTPPDLTELTGKNPVKLPTSYSK